MLSIIIRENTLINFAHCMFKNLLILLMIVGIGGESFQTNLIELYYQLNKAAITEKFCVNKDKPQMHCNGQCHLAKELKKATQPLSNSNNNKNFKSIQLFAQHATTQIFCLSKLKAVTHFNYTELINKGFIGAFFHPPTLNA